MTTSDLVTQPIDWADTPLRERPPKPVGTAYLLSRRAGNGWGALACALLLGFAYYLQYAEGLQSCPLCMVQRLIVTVLGIAFLAAALWDSRPSVVRLVSIAIALLAGIGVAAAGYQIWLQHQPHMTGFCLPPLGYLLDGFTLGEVLKLALKSPAGCGEVPWTFLGLSFPAWTAVALTGLGASGIWRNRITD